MARGIGAGLAWGAAASGLVVVAVLQFADIREIQPAPPRVGGPDVPPGTGFMREREEIDPVAPAAEAPPPDAAGPDDIPVPDAAPDRGRAYPSVAARPRAAPLSAPGLGGPPPDPAEPAPPSARNAAVMPGAAEPVSPSAPAGETQPRDMGSLRGGAAPVAVGGAPPGLEAPLPRPDVREKADPAAGQATARRADGARGEIRPAAPASPAGEARPRAMTALRDGAAQVAVGEAPSMPDASDAPQTLPGGRAGPAADGPGPVGTQPALLAAPSTQTAVAPSDGATVPPVAKSAPPRPRPVREPRIEALRGGDAPAGARDLPSVATRTDPGPAVDAPAAIPPPLPGDGAAPLPGDSARPRAPEV